MQITSQDPGNRELDYRLSKWILKNVEQLLKPDELEKIWQELLSLYNPPTRKEAPCKNTYVYEMARVWHVKEVMRRCLRKELVEAFSGIVERVVADTERKEKVRGTVRGLLDKPAEGLEYDDEDFLLAIKEIRFFPENVIKAEMIDGSVREITLNPCWPERERKRKKKTI